MVRKKFGKAWVLYKEVKKTGYQAEFISLENPRYGDEKIKFLLENYSATNECCMEELFLYKKRKITRYVPVKYATKFYGVKLKHVDYYAIHGDLRREDDYLILTHTCYEGKNVDGKIEIIKDEKDYHIKIGKKN